MAADATSDASSRYEVNVLFVGGKLEETRANLHELMADRDKAGWRLVSVAPMPVSGGIAAVISANLWLFWERERSASSRA